MINWFTPGGPMDISTEVASLMVSLLSLSVLFGTFGLMTWCAVKMYTNTWNKQEKKDVDTRFLH
jgi:hypothetical protein